MHFLPDVFVTCDVCEGRRYNRETLEVRYKGLSIAEVLDLTVDQARELFSAVPRIARILDTVAAVGLGYVHLGQPATTLSGGEAQRIKLSRELAKRATGKTLYLLDEPTTGLHFDDVRKLLAVLRALVDRGNTIVVIEHNLDVVKTADWVIDLGPEGGDGGGRIVATGTPESVAECAESHTGRYLHQILGRAVSLGAGSPARA
jgi:excinuclease ABC subunit A